MEEDGCEIEINVTLEGEMASAVLALVESRGGKLYFYPGVIDSLI